MTTGQAGPVCKGMLELLDATQHLLCRGECTEPVQGHLAGALEAEVWSVTSRKAD